MWKIHHHGDDKLQQHHTDVSNLEQVPHALLHASLSDSDDTFFDDNDGEHQPLFITTTTKDGQHQHQHQHHQQQDDNDDGDDNEDDDEKERKRKKKFDLPLLWCFSLVVFLILLLASLVVFGVGCYHGDGGCLGVWVFCLQAFGIVATLTTLT